MKKTFSNHPSLNTEVQDWWNNYPFQYFVHSKEGTWEYFRNIDRKFLKWCPYLQNGFPLLANVVDMYGLKGKKVLDIACGTGILSEQFARMGAEVTAIDLTQKAVELTKKRFEVGHLEGTILQADAQNLPFENESFDFVCAWGCLMHMPQTEKAISEIHRVLKPGGKMFAMMYYKDSIHLRIAIQLYYGIIRLQYLRYDNQSLINRYTDGNEKGGNNLTKFYSKKEFKQLFSTFSEYKIDIEDADSLCDALPHPWLPLGKLLPRFVKRAICKRWGLEALISCVK
jgi:ubiquinone/menaquinone biosynthesis C-methylase UbiE